MNRFWFPSLHYRHSSALALLLLGVACREPTQITVEIETDIACKELTGTELRLGDIGALGQWSASAATEQCSQAVGVRSRVGSIVLLAGEQRTESVAFELAGGWNAAPSVC